MLNVYQKRWIKAGVGATVASFLLCDLVKDQPLGRDKIIITRKDLVKLIFAGGLAGVSGICFAGAIANYLPFPHSGHYDIVFRNGKLGIGNTKGAEVLLSLSESDAKILAEALTKGTDLVLCGR